MENVYTLSLKEIKKLFFVVSTIYIMKKDCSISFVKENSDRYKMIIRGMSEIEARQFFLEEGYLCEYDSYTTEHRGEKYEYSDLYIVKTVTESSMLNVKNNFDENGFPELINIISGERTLKCYKFNESDVVVTPWNLSKTISWYNKIYDETYDVEEIMNNDKIKFVNDDSNEVTLSDELLKDKYKLISEPCVVCSSEY